MVQLAVRPLHLALILLVIVVWGANFAITKIGLESLPPLLLICLRFVAVALILAPFARFPRYQWKQMLALSFVLGGMHFGLMFVGLRTLDASTAAIAIQLQVPFAALLSAIFLKDRIGWRRALGMMIAFSGVAVIAGEPRLGGQYGALAMVLAAALVWAIANMMIKGLKDLDGIQINVWLAIFAAPQLLLASLVLETGQLEAIRSAEWTAWFAVVYQAVVVVVLGYGIWYRMLKIYSVNQVIAFTLLVPPVGVASGVLVLGESITLGLIIGGCLTILGVGIITLRRPTNAGPTTKRY